MRLLRRRQGHAHQIRHHTRHAAGFLRQRLGPIGQHTPVRIGKTLISAKIGQARSEGDLSENGGYHAAREEQAHQEARIRQLEVMLRNAEIGEPTEHADTVTLYEEDRIVGYFGGGYLYATPERAEPLI